jgi:RHS repeat-associated protein
MKGCLAVLQRLLFLLVIPSAMTIPAPASAQTVEYMHTDALGSIVAITNASGVVVERNEYEPYGDDLAGVKDGPGFTGHVSDAATGLSYMQQRYYDPQVGRFLSVDPVTADSSGGNFNRYWYANNNPYKFTDPDGRLPILIPVIITGISLFMTSGDANAPAPGERTSSMSAGQAAVEVASASPAGKLGSAVKMAASAGKMSQRAASREAKRQAGVPTSQQPASQTNGRADGVAAGRQQSYEVPKPGGGTETKSVQVSRDIRGDHAGMPQIEAGTVKPGGQVDAAGRPRIQNESKVRVDFDPKK